MNEDKIHSPVCEEWVSQESVLFCCISFLFLHVNSLALYRLPWSSSVLQGNRLNGLLKHVNK